MATATKLKSERGSKRKEQAGAGARICSGCSRDCKQSALVTVVSCAKYNPAI